MREILETIDIGAGVQLAPLVRAGRWIFSQGNLPTRHLGGICSLPPASGADPLLLEPAALSQGRWVLDTLTKRLIRAGASLDDLVRVDQYYDRIESVHPYHLARHDAFKAMIPPSTSIIVDGLLTPGATLCLEAIAAVGGRERREAVSASGVPMPRASSGFAPVMRVDEFAFIAGQVADSMDGSGIAPEATMNPEFVWDGSEIARQSKYVLDNLLRAAEAAGSDREHLIKAQVYLRSMDDLPEFDQVWKQVFGSDGPVRTVVPTSGLALRRGIIEVNLVGVTRTTAITRHRGAHPWNGVRAVTAGEMTCLSGVSAEDAGHLSPRVVSVVPDRHVRSVAAEETEAIIDQVESSLAAAGATLADITRINQFHTDLRDFLPSVQVWQRRLGAPVPISAVQVHGPLVPAGASILADCWAVA